MVIPQIRKAREQKHVYVFSHGSLSTFSAPFRSWTGAQISEQRSRDACCFRTFPSFNCSQSWYGSFKAPWRCSRHLPRPRACSITRWQLFTFHQNSCTTSLRSCASCSGRVCSPWVFTFWNVHFNLMNSHLMMEPRHGLWLEHMEQKPKLNYKKLLGIRVLLRGLSKPLFKCSILWYEFAI